MLLLMFVCLFDCLAKSHLLGMTSALLRTHHCEAAGRTKQTSVTK